MGPNDYIEELALTHNRVLVQAKNRIYWKEGKKALWRSISIGELGLKFIETFLQKLSIDATKARTRGAIYKISEDEEETLAALHTIDYELINIYNESGWSGCVNFLEGATHEAIWCDDANIFKLLEQCGKNGSDPKTTAIALAFHDVDFGYSYENASDEAEAAQKVLTYIKAHPNHPNFLAKKKIKKKKKLVNQLDLLVDKHGKLIELRDGRKGKAQYFMYSSNTGGAIREEMDLSVQKFIENELKLVDAHTHQGIYKHRVFSVNEKELVAIKALNVSFANIENIYLDGGWTGVAERYARLSNMLKNPFSDAELLDEITNYDDLIGSAARVILVEMIRTGALLKDVVNSLKTSSPRFVRIWQHTIGTIQKEMAEYRPLLPYFCKILPDVTKNENQRGDEDG